MVIPTYVFKHSKKIANIRLISFSNYGMANFHSTGTRGRSVANWILSTPSTSPSNECLTLDRSIASVTMDTEDPWYWDIDRVVAELCTDSRSWTSDTVRSRRRPNFLTLEAALREQEIDG